MEHSTLDFVYDAGAFTIKGPFDSEERETMRSFHRPLCPWLAILAGLFSGVPRAGSQVVGRPMFGGNGPVVGSVVRIPAAESVASGPWHLHPQSGQALPFRISDGEGFPWHIHQYGFEQTGKNSVFNHCMYLYVEGSNFGWNQNTARVSRDGREIEVGPYDRNSIRYYRRIRVFKDRGLARWVDLCENTTDRPMVAHLRYRTSMRSGIRSIQFRSLPGREDKIAMVTTSHNSHHPAVMHLISGPGAACSPSNLKASASRSDLQWEYRYQIPPGRTIAFCHFVAQDDDASGLKAKMNYLIPRRYLRDLPTSLREAIVNLNVDRTPATMLLRDNRHDVVVPLEGKKVLGKLKIEQVVLDTVFGRIMLPSRRVLGMRRLSRELDFVQVVLSDGQALVGRLQATEIPFEPATGGVQSYPISRLAQWSFRLGDQKPAQPEFQGPLVLLDTGDRLRLDPESLSLRMRTAEAMLDLDPSVLHRLLLGAEAENAHEAVFSNGSNLKGLVLGPTFKARLDLGHDLAIPLTKVDRVLFTQVVRRNPLLTRITLDDGSDLFVRIDPEPLRLRTDFGEASIRPGSIQHMLSLTQQRVLVTIWNGSVFRGQIDNAKLAARIEPGPDLHLNLDRIVRLHRNTALPPDDIVRKVRHLVRRLDAPSYRKRQQATEELKQMGEGIAALLREHLAEAAQLEVRYRLQEILEAYAQESTSPSAPPPSQQELPIQILVQPRGR